MLTLKFGGTSMGSARRILDSVDIMVDRAKQDRISVVVSAVAGVSNKLQEAIDGCVAGGNAEPYVSQMRTIHEEICSEIKSSLPSFDYGPVKEKLEHHMRRLDKLLSGLTTFGECPDSV
ncbi:MAG: bifunctional aspartate kinase/homoserine dehydrogenase I, partial [Treponema sp.]|nr:bifunctional aspartate kinase/homoserine dehydrogenase I [Treponema sp.]